MATNYSSPQDFIMLRPIFTAYHREEIDEDIAKFPETFIITRWPDTPLQIMPDACYWDDAANESILFAIPVDRSHRWIKATVEALQREMHGR